MVSFLQRDPNLVSITLKSVHKNLHFAQQRLLDPYIPHELKTRSYVRICCSAISTYQRLGLSNDGIFRSKTPYLTLLGMLSSQDVNWWETCTISSSGYLRSNDAVIDQLLHPLNQLVAQHLGCQAA